MSDHSNLTPPERDIPWMQRFAFIGGLLIIIAIVGGWVIILWAGISEIPKLIFKLFS